MAENNEMSVIFLILQPNYFTIDACIQSAENIFPMFVACFDRANLKNVFTISYGDYDAAA